jgi:hypothetical protein
MELRGLSQMEIESTNAKYEMLKPKQFYKYIFGTSNYERKLKELDNNKMLEFAVMGMKNKPEGGLSEQIVTLQNSLYAGHLILIIERIFRLSAFKI